MVVIDRPFSFVTEPAVPPGGYYKADGNNVGLRWVVLNNGMQSGASVGLDGQIRPAPKKPSTGSVEFQGQTLQTVRVTTLWGQLP